MNKSEKTWRALHFLNSHPAFGMGDYSEGFLSWATIWPQAYDLKGKTVDVPLQKKNVHRIEWYADISFSVFAGNPKSEKDHSNPKKWGRFQGIMIKSKTFDDMIIKSAKSVAEVFGAFDNYKCFLTDEEKSNHEKEIPFFFKPIPKSKKYSEMIKNPEYIDVSSAEINLRWASWFATTKWCKSNWENRFDYLLKKKVVCLGKPLDLDFIS